MCERRAVAVVTGATRGLGRALVLELARRRWSLVVGARDPSRVRALADELALARLPAVALAGDVGDASYRDELVNAAADLGGIDLLVNNAAVLQGRPAEVLAVNVAAPMELVRLAAPHLNASSQPRVVNISSEAAVEIRPGLLEYCASKAALNHYSAVLAAERPSWRVWSVDPGEMRTDMLAEACPGRDLSDRTAPAVIAARLATLVESGSASGRILLWS